MRADRALGCLAAIALASCLPGVVVSGAREGSDVVFSIGSSPWPFHDLPVRSIAVFKYGNREEAPDCELVSTEAYPKVLHRWTYGTAPDGFRLERCAPLATEVRYTIDVNAVGLGHRDFVLARDGNISQNSRLPFF